MLNIIYLGIYVAIVIAVMFIYIAMFTLNGEYKYGDALRKQCSPTFMEKERGEHQAYKAYLKSARGNFRNGNTILVTCVSIILFIYIMHLCIILMKSLTTRLKGLELPSYGNYTVPQFVINYHAIIPLMILILFIILLSIILSYNFRSDSICNTYVLNIVETPVNFDKDKKRYREHVGFIWSILIIMILVTMFYNPIFEDDTTVRLLGNNNPTVLYASFIIIGIVVSILFELIIEFQGKISYNYGTYKDELNRLIITELKGDNPQKILMELEKNIVKDEKEERLGEQGIGAPSNILTDSRYNTELYKYLMHIINNYDITSITIPQEIKPLLNPMYLGGENIISLKQELVATYYRHNNKSPIVPEDVEPGGIDNSLLQFLNSDIRTKFATDHPEKYDYIQILNTHIVNNSSFKKGNPLSKQMIDLMTINRQSTEMKDSIYKFSKILNIILTIIMILIAYYIYHFVIYKNSIEDRIQKVSLFAFIILLIISMIFWFYKSIRL